MVELIKSAHKRSLIADIIHILFNVLYAIAVTAFVILFPTSPWAAYALVIIAKWRTVAVRTRFWRSNILANLPDTLFGLGIVTLMWVSASLSVQILLTGVYVIWLVLIKSLYKRHHVMIQAGITQFVSLAALSSVAYLMPVWVAVLITFVIGFSVARQALGTYDEADRSFLSAVWGLVLAEMVFVFWHWTIAYQIMPGLKVSQFAIIAAALAFIAIRCYNGWHDDHKISWKEIRTPVIFVGILIISMLLFFSGLWDASTL